MKLDDGDNGNVEVESPEAIEDELLFSERNAMERLIREDLKKRGASDCPLNTISFLRRFS